MPIVWCDFHQPGPKISTRPVAYRSSQSTAGSTTERKQSGTMFNKNGDVSRMVLASNGRPPPRPIHQRPLYSSASAAQLIKPMSGKPMARQRSTTQLTGRPMRVDELLAAEEADEQRPFYNRIRKLSTQLFSTTTGDQQSPVSSTRSSRRYRRAGNNRSVSQEVVDHASPPSSSKSDSGHAEDVREAHKMRQSAMNDWEIAGNKNSWVCPSDRHLTLRAKLHSGWSVHTHGLSTGTLTAGSTVTNASGGSARPTTSNRLSDAEQKMLDDVIRRAELSREREELRIGKLIDRVDNLKIRATGNGVTQCLLCGADFGLLATYAAMCVHCRKYVCQKNCGTVTTDPVKRETQFSCKICTEQKEIWKKTNGWFYKKIPSYRSPSSSPMHVGQSMHPSTSGQSVMSNDTRKSSILPVSPRSYGETRGLRHRSSMAHIAVALGSDALLRRPSSLESSIMLERIHQMQRKKSREMRENEGQPPPVQTSVSPVRQPTWAQTSKASINSSDEENDLYKTDSTAPASAARHRSRTQHSNETSMPAPVKKTTSVSVSYDTKGAVHAVHRQKCAPRKYDSDSESDTCDIPQPTSSKLSSPSNDVTPRHTQSPPANQHTVETPPTSPPLSPTADVHHNKQASDVSDERSVDSGVAVVYPKSDSTYNTRHTTVPSVHTPPIRPNSGADNAPNGWPRKQRSTASDTAVSVEPQPHRLLPVNGNVSISSAMNEHLAYQGESQGQFQGDFSGIPMPGYERVARHSAHNLNLSQQDINLLHSIDNDRGSRRNSGASSSKSSLTAMQPQTVDVPSSPEEGKKPLNETLGSEPKECFSDPDDPRRRTALRKWLRADNERRYTVQSIERKLSIVDTPPALTDEQRDASIVQLLKPRSTVTNVRQMSHHGVDEEDCVDVVDASLGQLEFTIDYDGDRQTMAVTLIRATSLISADSNGLSDPFVKLDMLPTTDKSTRQRTKTVFKTLNPEWNETLHYRGVGAEDLKRKTLRLTVYDQDRIGSDFLGETHVPLRRLNVEPRRHFNVFLEAHMATADPRTAIDPVADRGKIWMSIGYDQADGAFMVHLKECASLPGMDANGYSDPYVRLMLTPVTNSKKHKYKTHVKNRQCNPVFDQVFVFPIALKDLHAKSLEIGVFDRDIGSKDDYIGGLVLGNNERGDQQKHWQRMLHNADQTFTAWHKLTLEPNATMKRNEKSKLKHGTSRSSSAAKKKTVA